MPLAICYLFEQYPNALEQKDKLGMLPLHCCVRCFKQIEPINYPSLLDRMRLLLPGNPEAIDIAPHYHDDNGDWSLWRKPEEHDLYKEVSSLLLEQTSLRDQLECSKQVSRLDEIQGRLDELEDLLEEFRFDYQRNPD